MEGMTAPDLARADAAMCVGKRMGGGRVVPASEAEPAT
jgi:hypothetical protein